MFFINLDQCDLIGVKEDSTISIVDDHRDVFDLYDNINIRCTYYSAFMDQPPSWWYLSSGYIKINSNSQHYHTNYSYDNDKCIWSSDLTIKRLSLSLTGTYYCFRGQLNKSIDIELQGNCTVEPLIKDPLRRGQPLYKGHLQYPQKCICNTFESNLPTRDKMAGPKASFTQRFHCSSCLLICLDHIFLL